MMVHVLIALVATLVNVHLTLLVQIVKQILMNVLVRLVKMVANVLI